MVLLHSDKLDDEQARNQIETLTAVCKDKTRYFVDTLSYCIARIAASQHPNPVIVRMSDFKTNEYAQLIGGKAFEPEEADKVLEVMADDGLERGEHGLQVYVMAEIPANVVLADAFAQRFGGFSIGRNLKNRRKTTRRLPGQSSTPGNIHAITPSFPAESASS
jgi:pyruvate,water dikinase